jgi:uncharacterized protein (TIGR02646 family)
MTMIGIDRDRLGDGGRAILPEGTWRQRARRKTRLAISDGQDHKVTNLYSEPTVKAALEKLFYNKCAYCETTGFAGFAWDVEHFRPKASVAEAAAHPGYYWLAYTWTNLYPSCVFCNQRRKDQATFDNPNVGPATGKLDRFPLADEGARAYTPNDPLADEEPLLLDPCTDQPALHLEFDATGLVSPRDGSKKGEASISIFGLNRKRLVDARLEVLTTAGELIDGTVEEGVPRDRATEVVLQVMSGPKRPYGALMLAVRDDPARFGF